MTGSRANVRRTRAAIAATLAMTWFAPSYFLIGPFAGELARESVPASVLFLTAWFGLSTVLLVVLRRLAR